MEEEIRIRNKINNGVKRVLKRFKNYKLVDTIEEGHILLVFYRDDIEHFDVIRIDDEVKKFVSESIDNNFVLFYLCHKNNRNAERAVLSDITSRRFIRK